MNNKILVIVYVPMIEKDYDIYIPSVKKIGTIKDLIASIVQELSDGAFVNDGNCHLYDKTTGKMFDENQFVKQSEIINGSKLVLY